MPTTRTRYVDPDVSGGAGNGTSWANAYSSLNAAEQAEDNSGDITAATGSDEIVVFICGHNGASQTTADTAAVNVSGWTTAAANYIEIKTETADRHPGKWSTTKYRLTAGNASVLTVSEDYVRLDGLQSQKTTSSADLQAAILVGGQVATNNEIRISNCLARQAGNATYKEPVIYCQDADTILNIWNCICYGCGTSTSESNSALVSISPTNVYSSTLIGGSCGIREQGSLTIIAKNCYASGSSAAYSGTITQTTCASSDATATGTALDNIALNTTNFTNVSAGTEDFSLPATSALIGVGTDTSGESAPLNFTTDIVGTTRS